MRERECPKCGAPMEHQSAEPDVGITGGWACMKCEHVELDDDDQDD